MHVSAYCVSHRHISLFESSTELVIYFKENVLADLANKPNNIVCPGAVSNLSSVQIYI